MSISPLIISKDNQQQGRNGHFSPHDLLPGNLPTYFYPDCLLVAYQGMIISPLQRGKDHFLLVIEMFRRNICLYKGEKIFSPQFVNFSPKRYGIFYLAISLVSFHFLHGNEPIHLWKVSGTGFSSSSGEATRGGKKFPHESRKAQYFLHEWRSRSGEDKFPHERRSREWGNLFSPRLLCHILCALSDEWGNLPVPISPH